MDQASLCRFFKRAAGRTMNAYVNELRVGAAAQLLIDTDESILEIGFRVGFGNYSNFNRQFKRIKGFGPRTLRRQFSSEPSVESPFAKRAPALPVASLAKKNGKMGIQIGQLS
jgi:transcriptional regulator GlxA family with amidase domain